VSEYDSGLFIGEHHACLSTEFPITKYGKPRRSCNSSDGLAVYEHTMTTGELYYDAVCFSCKQGFTKEEVHSSSLTGNLGIDPSVGKVTKVMEFVNKASKKLPITREERDILWNKTGWEAKGFRGFTDEILKFYGHRTELNANGEVIAQYYPETEDYKLTGYKSCHEPKRFGIGNVGKTGLSSQLSGQHKFPEGGKYALIVGGEKDKIAAQIMLREYQVKKRQDGYNHYSVVSPTTGEPSAAKQCRQQYDWLNSHEVIVIGMDADEVGFEAALEIASVLPKEKVRIATWSGKDPNKMLLDGRQAQFLSDFFGAKPLIETGVYDANIDFMQGVIEVLTTPRIPLPPHMYKLQEMTKGAGLFTRSIYSLIGDTSVGKSTHIESMIDYWMFNVPDHKVGIVSLEANKEEWTASMLSTFLTNNLWWIPVDEVKDYLQRPDIVEKCKSFFYNEYGEPRFAILDDRENTVHSLEKNIERLVKQFGCTIIVNDVLTDVLRTASNEDQAAHFNWQSNLVKGGTTIFNVLHTRKSPSDRKGKPTFPDEMDTYGSSIFVQKAAGNFIIARNKNAPEDDMIEQNTTYMKVTKLRKGVTGMAGALYYDGESKVIADRDQFFAANPDKLPVGYDLSVSSFDKAYWEEGGRGYNGEGSEGSFSGNKQNKTFTINTDNAPIDVGGFTL